MTEPPEEPTPDAAPGTDDGVIDERLLEMGRLAELGLQAAELVHELRQPLFAVSGLAQLLEQRLAADPPDVAGARDMVATLRDQLGLLDGLAARYAGGSRRPSTATAAQLLAPPTTAAVQLFESRARAHGRQLVLDLRDAGTTVLADPVAVQQIVANLIGNALDASTAAVRVEVDGPRVRVRDDGPEPDADVLARAFEPFFTTKPVGKGTGLGLSVARHLVVQAGGTLELRREDGWTVVEARFPPVPQERPDGR
ncbi:MAG: HAMP domain-containing histidine kinase [Alphaproteobacteria bacterium]|nr:HAMP domain-containing histidine kinase [Alphaproteobacteria bacterium]